MIREYNGGPSWIRTRELKWDQIYSLAVLASSPKDPYKTADASHDNNWNVTSDAACPIYPNGIWKILDIFCCREYYEFTPVGAQRRSRTFKHWFLRPAALPVCIFVHKRSGATIVLNDTNPARKRVCTNWIICLLLAANWSLLTLVSRTRTLHIE